MNERPAFPVHPGQRLVDPSGRPMVAVPAWLFDESHTDCNYFLLSISGSLGEPDGCHSDPADVAHARRLIESLNCITKAPDRRYLMLRVEAVPDLDTRPVNQESIDLLNAAHEPAS